MHKYDKQEEYLFYFDCGTSNTRGYLLRDSVIVSVASRSIGSKDVSITGDQAVLLKALYAIYAEALDCAQVSDSQVKALYASGMITSPYGLQEASHMMTPVDRNTACQQILTYNEDSVLHRKIHLIRGVKTMEGQFTMDKISAVNNVRGEETEALGVCSHLTEEWKSGRHLIIIPGSHAHGLLMEQDTIVDLFSTFSGEIFHALTNATVLHTATSKAETEQTATEQDAVRFGCKILQEHGIARALYIVHAMKIFDVEGNKERRDVMSGIVIGATVQSFASVLNGKWKGTDGITIYGDEDVLENYVTAFAMLAPDLRRRLHLLSRNKVNCSVEGLLHIIGSNNLNHMIEIEGGHR